VCGEGPLREALETRLRQQGLDGAVRFEGYVRHGVELMDRYRHADALVITSRSEGLPQTVVEAFAAGLPVVSSDVGGIRAAFGAAAATVPPGDARAAAACLHRLHADPEARQRMADEGRIIARDHTLEAEARQLDEFLVASARPAAAP
jgi:glycosyltransferase involved in cell wall biosynthesis